MRGGRQRLKRRLCRSPYCRSRIRSAARWEARSFESMARETPNKELTPNITARRLGGLPHGVKNCVEPGGDYPRWRVYSLLRGSRFRPPTFRPHMRI
jgi:hypothetical protein